MIQDDWDDFEESASEEEWSSDGKEEEENYLPRRLKKRAPPRKSPPRDKKKHGLEMKAMLGDERPVRLIIEEIERGHTPFVKEEDYIVYGKLVGKAIANASDSKHIPTFVNSILSTAKNSVNYKDLKSTVKLLVDILKEKKVGENQSKHNGPEEELMKIAVDERGDGDSSYSSGYSIEEFENDFGFAGMQQYTNLEFNYS